MRVREIWREATRNFSTGASRGILAFVSFLALVLSLGGIAVRSVVGVETESEQFRESGASVFRIDATGKVDPSACDALAQVGGIDASGATRAKEAIRFSLLPDLPTPQLEITTGMAEFLQVDPANPEAGLILENELAETLGVEAFPAWEYLANSNEPVAIVGTYQHPQDGRDATLNGAALGISANREPFDSCWVRFWPPADNPLELLSLALIGGDGDSEATQWNPTLGRSFDPSVALHALPLNALTVASAVVAAVLAYVSVRLRRLELASARHVGVARADLVGITLAESAIWLIPASLIALIALTFLAAWGSPGPWYAAWAAGARVVGATAVTWLLTTGLTTAAIRETHLVRYFQQR